MYTAGAVVYARGRADPIAHLFGYHEVFTHSSSSPSLSVAAVAFFGLRRHEAAPAQPPGEPSRERRSACSPYDGVPAARRLTSTSWPLQEANVMLVLGFRGVSRELHLSGLGWHVSFPVANVQPEPVPGRLRRSRCQRGGAALPARLRGQGLDAATAGGVRLGWRWSASRSFRSGSWMLSRCCRSPSLRSRRVRDLPRPVDRGAALLRRMHRRPRDRAEARAVPVPPPVSALGECSSRRRSSSISRSTFAASGFLFCCWTTRAVCSALLLARSASGPRRPGARHPLHGGGGIDPADHRR